MKRRTLLKGLMTFVSVVALAPELAFGTKFKCVELEQKPAIVEASVRTLCEWAEQHYKTGWTADEALGYLHVRESIV